MDFFDKICKKGLEQKSEHHHQILHIPNIQVSSFNKKLIILKFLSKLNHKGYFRFKKENNESQQRILHIQISLGSKFQIQQTVLIF